VLAKFDAEKGEGKELAEKYAVQGYPTFVVADAQGRVMDSWSGYGKEHFLTQIGLAMADPVTMDEKRARFENEPDPDTGLRIARYFATSGKYADALAYVARSEKLEGAPDVAYTRFDYTFSAYTRANELTLDDVRSAADAVATSAGAGTQELVDVAQMMDYLGKKEEKPGLGVPYLAPALKATKGADGDLRRAHDQLAVSYAILVEKDEAKAVRLKRATMPDGWKDDVSALNSFAWWCFENKVNLEEGELLARRGADLATPGPERAMILDTAAEICNARGNCDDAVELIRKAVDDAPGKDYYTNQLKRFEEIRAASQAN